MGADESIIERLKRERIARRLTQSAMAGILNCSQSAISKFEGGRLDALSNDKIRQLADHLGVEIDVQSASKELVLARPPPVSRFAFCASPSCPATILFRPYRDVLWAVPALVPLARDEKPGWCEMCGEPMVDACPRCRAPASSAGAFCGACGAALVAVDEAMGGELRREGRIIEGDPAELRRANREVEAWLCRRRGEGRA